MTLLYDHPFLVLAGLVLVVAGCRQILFWFDARRDARLLKQIEEAKTLEELNKISIRDKENHPIRPRWFGKRIQLLDEAQIAELPQKLAAAKTLQEAQIVCHYAPQGSEIEKQARELCDRLYNEQFRARLDDAKNSSEAEAVFEDCDSGSRLEAEALKKYRELLLKEIGDMTDPDDIREIICNDGREEPFFSIAIRRYLEVLDKQKGEKDA